MTLELLCKVKKVSVHPYIELLSFSPNEKKKLFSRLTMGGPQPPPPSDYLRTPLCLGVHRLSVVTSLLQRTKTV